MSLAYNVSRREASEIRYSAVTPMCLHITDPQSVGRLLQCMAWLNSCANTARRVIGWLDGWMVNSSPHVALFTR